MAQQSHFRYVAQDYLCDVNRTHLHSRARIRSVPLSVLHVQFTRPSSPRSPKGLPFQADIDCKNNRDCRAGDDGERLFEGIERKETGRDESDTSDYDNG
jgi:hypothetical protein